MGHARLVAKGREGLHAVTKADKQIGTAAAVDYLASALACAVYVGENYDVHVINSFREAYLASPLGRGVNAVSPALTERVGLNKVTIYCQFLVKTR